MLCSAKAKLQAAPEVGDCLPFESLGVPKLFRLATCSNAPVLALGGELKATVALYHGHFATLSPCFGNLTNPNQFRKYWEAVDGLARTARLKPRIVVHDLHPNYLSTRLAMNLGLPTIGVQHHHAHVVSVMADQRITHRVIGICCDGVGFGTDHASWGCEILDCRLHDFKRLGHLDYFPLLGGDAAAMETWRPALAMVQQALGEQWRLHAGNWFDRVPENVLLGMAALARSKLPIPQSSSLGRVFDGVSFLLGLCDKNAYEAQAAIELENAATHDDVEPYPYETRTSQEGLCMSLSAAVRAILRDLARRASYRLIASRFHETVARLLASTAALAAEQAGLQTIVLSGGCFANARLRQSVMTQLQRAGFRVVVPTRVSLGDAGLALGQAVIAAAIHERTG